MTEMRETVDQLKRQVDTLTKTNELNQDTIDGLRADIKALIAGSKQREQKLRRIRGIIEETMN
jgi:chaperonin cofactor prefoldin